MDEYEILDEFEEAQEMCNEVPADRTDDGLIQWRKKNLSVGNVVQNTIMISVQPKMFLYVDGVQVKKKNRGY